MYYTTLPQKYLLQILMILDFNGLDYGQLLHKISKSFKLAGVVPYSDPGRLSASRCAPCVTHDMIIDVV